MEIMSSKDIEGLLEAMILKMELYKRRPELDHNRVYYVLQGPGYFINKFYVAFNKRMSIAIGCNPNNSDLTSQVYFSNYPEIPNAFKLNAHYKSLLLVRETQTSNLLGSMIFPIPDIGKVELENKEDTCYQEPNKDLNSFILKQGY